MTTETKKPLKLFYCYAREDKALRDELDVHLSSLKRQNIITSWYDGAINPGSDWEKEIDTHLREAHLILLLITPHFMASDYCYSVEMQRALQRDKDGTARVIPIILRRTNWEDAPFSILQVLPSNVKPVTQWPDRDEAFWNITIGIKKAITELRRLGIDNLIVEINVLYHTMISFAYKWDQNMPVWELEREERMKQTILHSNQRKYAYLTEIQPQLINVVDRISTTLNHPSLMEILNNNMLEAQTNNIGVRMMAAKLLQLCSQLEQSKDT